jgi:hypothetical protein
LVDDLAQRAGVADVPQAQPPRSARGP